MTAIRDMMKKLASNKDEYMVENTNTVVEVLSDYD
jgi:hypothetical protein